MTEAKRVINGTYGEAWLDGEQIGEITGLQAKINYKKEVVTIQGDPAEHQKVIGYSGTGSLEMHKVNSRLAKKLQNSTNGKTAYCTVISKLDDPDAYGSERIALYEVSFDDLTLADWKSATKGTITAPFTFAKYEFLDTIEQERKYG